MLRNQQTCFNLNYFYNSSTKKAFTSKERRVDCLLSSDRRSLGRNNRTLLMEVISFMRTGMTAISFLLWSSVAGLGRTLLDRRVSLLQFSSTSTTNSGSGSESMGCAGRGCFFWKFTTTPQPNSWSALRTCTRGFYKTELSNCIGV